MQWSGCQGCRRPLSDIRTRCQRWSCRSCCRGFSAVPACVFPREQVPRIKRMIQLKNRWQDLGSVQKEDLQCRFYIDTYCCSPPPQTDPQSSELSAAPPQAQIVRWLSKASPPSYQCCSQCCSDHCCSWIFPDQCSCILPAKCSADRCRHCWVHQTGSRDEEVCVAHQSFQWSSPGYDKSLSYDRNW